MPSTCAELNLVDCPPGRAVTHYFTAEQIRWCEGGILTDRINLYNMEGIIDISFEAASKETNSQPSYRFQLLYNKKAEYEGRASLCKLTMFRPNRNSVAKALWLVRSVAVSLAENC